MSDPGTDPAHDLVDHPQDRPQPRVRLGTVLALLRVAGGPRGHARILWNRDGFTYTLSATCEPGSPIVDFDIDPDALGGTDALDRITDALD